MSLAAGYAAEIWLRQVYLQEAQDYLLPFNEEIVLS